MMIQLVGFNSPFLDSLRWQLANLDGLTAGVILLFSCVVWLVLNGGSNQRKRRRLTGVTTPPGENVETYLKRLDKFHNAKVLHDPEPLRRF